MKSLRAIVFAVQFLLFGCAQSLGYVLPKDESLRLLIYMGGKPIQECTISADNPAHEALATWLASNQVGWRWSPIGRVPSTLVLGSTFSFNLIGSTVEVAHAGKTFTKTVVPAELVFLRCGGGA
jgi:hypothetical protein